MSGCPPEDLAGNCLREGLQIWECDICGHRGFSEALKACRNFENGCRAVRHSYCCEDPDDRSVPFTCLHCKYPDVDRHRPKSSDAFKLTAESERDRSGSQSKQSMPSSQQQKKPVGPGGANGLALATKKIGATVQKLSGPSQTKVGPSAKPIPKSTSEKSKETEKISTAFVLTPDDEFLSVKPQKKDGARKKIGRGSGLQLAKPSEEPSASRSAAKPHNDMQPHIYDKESSKELKLRDRRREQEKAALQRKESAKRSSDLNQTAQRLFKVVSEETPVWTGVLSVRLPPGGQPSPINFCGHATSAIWADEAKSMPSHINADVDSLFSYDIKDFEDAVEHACFVVTESKSLTGPKNPQDALHFYELVRQMRSGKWVASMPLPQKEHLEKTRRTLVLIPSAGNQKMGLWAAFVENEVFRGWNASAPVPKGILRKVKQADAYRQKRPLSWGDEDPDGAVHKQLKTDPLQAPAASGMELDPKALEARVREAMLHLSVGPPSKESRMRKVLLRLDSMKLPDAVRENIFPLEGWIFSCLKSSGDQSRENVHATTEEANLDSQEGLEQILWRLELMGAKNAIPPTSGTGLKFVCIPSTYAQTGIEDASHCLYDVLADQHTKTKVFLGYKILEAIERYRRMPDSRELAELGITEAFPTGITVVTDADTLVKHQDLLDKVVQSLKKGRDCCPRKDVVWQLVLTKTQVASLRTQNPTLLRSFFKAKELNLAHEALKEETSYKKAGTNEENETWKTAKKVARRRVRICRNVVFTSIEASRDPLLWEDALWETTINVIPPEEAATFVESLCNLD